MDMETDSSPEADESSHFSVSLRVIPDTTKKQVSVLMLTPQWRFDEYGMATITRSLVKNLRMIDPKGSFIEITCAVLEDNEEIKRDQLHDAQELAVNLVGYVMPRGRKKDVDLQWLNEDVMKYYNHVLSETKYDFIIGHAPLLRDGCLNIRDFYSEQTPKVVLIVQGFEKYENGEIDAEQVNNLNEADVVLSMEKSIHEKLSIRSGSLDKPPDFKMYFPDFATDFFQTHRQEKRESGQRKILMMTNETKNLKVASLDPLLAVNAITEANQKTKAEMTVTMFTEKSDEIQEWANEFKGNIHSEMIQDEDYLKHCMKYSELFLLPLKASSPLFGSEALSAIAAGVPVLVPRHSAIGCLLLEMDQKNAVVSETDYETWVEEIIQKVVNPVAAQTAANKLRDRLLLDTRIPSTHLDFINIITGMFPSAIMDVGQYI